MKICLVGGIYKKGGARSSYIKSTPETILEDGLRAAGHDVTTLSHYDDVPFDKYDLVHVHHLSYGATRVASDPSRTPFIFTPHDTADMTGDLSKIRQMATRYIFARADAIVSLSTVESQWQIATYPTKGAVVEVIPNGIDANRFPMVRRNKMGKDAPWKFLFVGQLIPIKACDVLLKGVAKLTRPWELNMAYQNPALETMLKDLARTLGIADRVHFLGKQDPDALATLHQTSDLLLLPSVTEALPSVITEAMLSGLPFVAMPVGGIREQSGGFGSLMKERTPECLASTIEDVLSRYSEFAATSQAMGDHARATFSIEAMLARHIRLYENIAKIRVPRRAGKSILDTIVRVGVRKQGQGRTLRSPAASKQTA